MPDCLSAEKGVLISRKGLCWRCLEIRDSLARGVARAEVVRGTAKESGPEHRKARQDDSLGPRRRFGRDGDRYWCTKEQRRWKPWLGRFAARERSNVCNRILPNHQLKILRCFFHAVEQGLGGLSALWPVEHEITLQTRRIIYKQIRPSSPSPSSNHPASHKPTPSTAQRSHNTTHESETCNLPLGQSQSRRGGAEAPMSKPSPPQ